MWKQGKKTIYEWCGRGKVIPLKPDESLAEIDCCFCIYEQTKECPYVKNGIDIRDSLPGRKRL